MKTSKQLPTIMGMSLEIYKMYNREYARLNPHSLPGLRPKRRRIMRSEMVFSTH